jgi:hypothetical protein
MKPMERTLANVTESGELILDDEARNALGVPSGGQIEIVRGDQYVELRKKPVPISEQELHQAFADLRELFARKPGEPSLEDDLYKMRREEEVDLESLAGSLHSHTDLVAELQQERRQDKW